jgi:hypothetical protein
MYDMSTTKAITVRVRASALRKVMRSRRFRTQSQAINSLVAEEVERLEAVRAIRAGAGSLKSRDLDDRLL